MSLITMHGYYIFNGTKITRGIVAALVALVRLWKDDLWLLPDDLAFKGKHNKLSVLYPLPSTLILTLWPVLKSSTCCLLQEVSSYQANTKPAQFSLVKTVVVVLCISSEHTSIHNTTFSVSILLSIIKLTWYPPPRHPRRMIHPPWVVLLFPLLLRHTQQCLLQPVPVRCICIM